MNSSDSSEECDGSSYTDITVVPVAIAPEPAASPRKQHFMHKVINIDRNSPLTWQFILGYTLQLAAKSGVLLGLFVAASAIVYAVGKDEYTQLLRSRSAHYLNHGSIEPRTPGALPPLLGLFPDAHFIFDTHVHSLHSDGRFSVRDILNWHILTGFNVIFITDHNTVSHVPDALKAQAELAPHGIVVLTGLEFTSRNVHFNCLGVTEWHLPLPATNAAGASRSKVQQAISHCHSLGGLVTWNHPTWTDDFGPLRTLRGRKDGYTVEEGVSWGADFVEVISSYVDYGDGFRYDDSASRHLDQIHASDPSTARVVGIASSDIHSPLRNDGGVFGVTYAGAAAVGYPLTPDGVMSFLRDKPQSLETTAIGSGTSTPPTGSEMNQLLILTARIVAASIEYLYAVLPIAWFTLLLALAFVDIILLGLRWVSACLIRACAKRGRRKGIKPTVQITVKESCEIVSDDTSAASPAVQMHDTLSGGPDSPLDV